MRTLLMLMMLTVYGVSQGAEVRELTWEALVPPDAPKIAPVMTPMHDLSKLASGLAELAPAAHQAEPHAPVVKALDGLEVRLPGYIVPLEVGEDGRTTDFLLVPYYGACIHVPPPPSNQIVHVTTEAGVKIDELYQPYWIEGRLLVKASGSELAQAGYQMEGEKIFAYELPD